MSETPDFTPDELNTINVTLTERFGKEIETHTVDTEVRLYKGDRELTEVPAVYWEANDCQFIVIKKGENRFHNQFFYGVNRQYGTGIEEYDDLFKCTVTLLQVQADHAVKEGLAKDSSEE